MNIETSLNNGSVPIGSFVGLYANDMLEFLSNKDKIQKTILGQSTRFQTEVEKLTKGTVINPSSLEPRMCTYIDDDTLKTKVITSPLSILTTLSTLLYTPFDGKEPYELYLSINPNLNTNERMKKALVEECESYKAKIKSLRVMPDETTFKYVYPNLYKDYAIRKDTFDPLKQLSFYYQNAPREQKKQIIKTLKAKSGRPNADFKTLLKQASTFSLSSFINEQCDALEQIIDSSSTLFDKLVSQPIKLRGISNDDQQKLELYIAAEYLYNASIYPANVQQVYLYFVSNYFSKNKDLLDSDVSISFKNLKALFPDLYDMDEEHPVLTPRMLYDKYRQLLIDNPNLRVIDFSNVNFEGMSQDEVENFMTEYLKDLDANWEILPQDDKSYEEDVINRIKGSGKQLTEEEKQKHQDHLLDIFMEKKEFYDSSDPFFRIKGKGSFDGYIGYIYKNGHVVLDKFFEDSDNGKLADGQAIYAMNIDQFYELSRLSKSEIIKNKLCRRYIHRGNWQDRVLQNEILAEAGINPSDDVKQLIKTGKINPIEENPTEDSSNK